MCPPGVDQTTRSAAKWQVLALETRQRQGLEDNMTPYQFLAKRGSMDAFRRLYRLDRSQSPVVDPGLTFVPEQASNEGCLPRSPYSYLEKMPPELMSMITAYLLSPSPLSTQGVGEEHDDWGREQDPSTSESDLIALALCSRTLWNHVINRVYSLCNPIEGVWAGKTLICTSTWLVDVPDGVSRVYPNMKESCERWRARVASQRGRGRRAFDGPGMNPVRSWNWDAYSCWKWPGSDMPEQRLREAFARFSKHEFHIGSKTGAVIDQLENTLEKLLNPTKPWWESDDQQSWTLQNLDTKEYVRLELIDQHDLKTDGFIVQQRGGTRDFNGEDDSGYMSGESSASEEDLDADGGQEERQLNGNPVSRTVAVAGLPWLTADFILMSRIGWSSPDEWGEELDRVHRGPWAGHRFAITKAADVETYGGNVKDEKEWTDVTELITNEAESLRESINRNRGNLR